MSEQPDASLLLVTNAITFVMTCFAGLGLAYHSWFALLVAGIGYAVVGLMIFLTWRAGR